MFRTTVDLLNTPPDRVELCLTMIELEDDTSMVDPTLTLVPFMDIPTDAPLTFTVLLTNLMLCIALSVLSIVIVVETVVPCPASSQDQLEDAVPLF